MKASWPCPKQRWCIALSYKFTWSVSRKGCLALQTHCFSTLPVLEWICREGSHIRHTNCVRVVHSLTMAAVTNSITENITNTLSQFESHFPGRRQVSAGLVLPKVLVENRFPCILPVSGSCLHPLACGPSSPHTHLPLPPLHLLLLLSPCLPLIRNL